MHWKPPLSSSVGICLLSQVASLPKLQELDLNSCALLSEASVQLLQHASESDAGDAQHPLRSHERPAGGERKADHASSAEQVL